VAGDEVGCLHGLLLLQKCVKQRSPSCAARKTAAQLRKLPTPVLSGSGSRVISQPHNTWSTPVSITRLKHYFRRFCKSAGLATIGVCPVSASRGKAVEAAFGRELMEPGAREAAASTIALELPFRQRWRWRERRAWPAGPLPKPDERDNALSSSRTGRKPCRR